MKRGPDCAESDPLELRFYLVPPNLWREAEALWTVGYQSFHQFASI